MEFKSLANDLHLLIKGYIEYEASIIMSEQQALNYSETLRSAIKDVKEFKKNV